MFRQYQSLLYGPLGQAPKILLLLLISWSIFWKGLALWKSAKNNQKYWFITVLVVNTVGILEIIYLSFFQKVSSKSVKKTQ